MSDLGWLWDGRSWHDQEQNERLESLSSALSHQHHEAGRLQARLAKVQGDLQQRLNGLATAFDAFVVLTDLREELRAFQPVADARHRARRVVARLITSGRSADLPVLPPPADPSPEFGDYWLPGAVTGLVATVEGERVAADAALAAARRRDAGRTDLFLCLALALSDRLEPAVGLLPGLLDVQPDRPVTRAQRELWLAAGAGRFGERGREVLVGRLAAVTAGLPDDVRATEAAAWRSLVAGVGADVGAVAGVPSSAADLSGLVGPLRAARQLDVLALWYAEVSRPAPTDRVVPTGLTGEGPPDPLFALLRELVDEGVPDEQPLLARMTELRRVIEADGGTPAPAAPRWDAAVETPLALLRADVDADEPGRRAVAARAGGPFLAAVAADLVAAASAPLPGRTDVRIGRHTVGFTSTGADAGTVAAAREATLTEPPPPDARATRVGWSLLAAAAVAVAVAVVVPALALVVGVAGLAGVGGAWLLIGAAAGRHTAEAQAERSRSEWGRTEHRITEIGAGLADLRERAGWAATDAAAARARLEGELAGTAAAPPLSPR